MKFSRLKPLLAWRYKPLMTAEQLAASLSVEALPYADAPPEFDSVISGFRERRQAERVAVCRRFIRELERSEVDDV
jgi:hypothetical protein